MPSQNDIYKSNTLEHAGHYNISDVAIITTAGQVANISSAVMEINVYEDLHSNFLSGNIVFVDTVDIVNTLPILGQEYLEFKFRTPIESNYEEGEYDFTRQRMSIFKVTRNRLNQNSEAITLDFVSPEAIRNQNIKISRAFNGPYDDAVAKIFKKSWGLNSKKKLYIQPTQNNFKFITPNIRPSDIINMIASRAVPKTSNLPGYFFYENGQGFHFRSIDSFWFNVFAGELQPHPEMFEYFLSSDATSGLKNPNESPLSQLRTVRSFKLIQYNDLIKNIRRGTFASTLITHDAFNKTYNTYKYNYVEDYNRVSHLEKNKEEFSGYDNAFVPYYGLVPKTHYDSDDTEFSELTKNYKNLADYESARIMLQSNTANLHNTNSTKGFRVDEYLQRRQSILSIVENLELQLTVPGNTHLNIGHVIRLNVPRSGPGKSGDINTQNDKYLTGRWLITAIHHKIDITSQYHSMILTCIKETYGATNIESNKILQLNNKEEGLPVNISNNNEYN